MNAVRHGKPSARRVTSQLLLSTDARVRTAGLHNPRLRDADLCALLESDEAPGEIAAEILQVHRWALSYQVRRAIIRSSTTPHTVSLPLIARLNRGDLRDLAQSDEVSGLVSAVARRLLR